jgi:outer membrane protein OmpA-like peptidoglycan-associated protein
MRATAVLVLLLSFLTSAAQAQVSVDMHALDSTGPAQASGHAPERRLPPERRPPVHRSTAAKKPEETSRSASSGSVTDHTAQKPAPPAVATAPIPALPTGQPAEPPASTTIPAATQSPVPLPPPVELVFAEGKTDLTPADEAAIQELARAIPQPAADSVNVIAYAAGKPDDPSTARRVSLSRGLAVRSVLLASGVPSAQIYVRALGATPSNGPADRVELTVAPIGTLTR